MIVLVIATYICLFLFENVPTSLILCGLIAQVKLLILDQPYTTLLLLLSAGCSFGIIVKLSVFLGVKSCLRHGGCDGSGQPLLSILTFRGEILPFQ